MTRRSQKQEAQLKFLRRAAEGDTAPSSTRGTDHPSEDGVAYKVHRHGDTLTSTFLAKRRCAPFNPLSTKGRHARSAKQLTITPTAGS